MLKEKKYGDVEAALKAYLTNHADQAQPWMYEWLIKASEVLKRPDGDIKTAFGYAAMLAKKTKNPNDLVRLADMMVLRNFYGSIGSPGYETNIGELIDLATEKVPSNAIPPMMSINLARHTKDPARMAAAADRLLSSGWAGIDEKMRKDVSQQVEDLEKVLRDDNKPADAELLAKSVAQSEIRDVYVSLKWTGEADLDLSVEEPLGATCRFQTPRTVFGGAMLKNGYLKHPEEVYVCPRGFDGDYTVRVGVIYIDEAKPVKEATLTVITHEGGADEQRQETKINLDRPTAVVVKLTGGRRKEVLPFIPPPEVVSLETRKPAPSAPKAPTPATAAPTKSATKGKNAIPIQ